MMKPTSKPKANRKPRDPRLMRALGYRAYAAKLAHQGDSGWEHYFNVATRLYDEVRRDRERKKAREAALKKWIAERGLFRPY